MRCLNDLRSTKLKKKWKVQKDFRLGSDEKVCFTSKTAAKNISKKEITYQRTTFSDRTLNSTTKAFADTSNFPKSIKIVDLKTIQTCSRGKTKIEFMDPNNFRQDKNWEEGPKLQKIGKTVAAATIGNYLVNLDLWTISSLSNRLFDNKPTCWNIIDV